MLAPFGLRAGSAVAGASAVRYAFQALSPARFTRLLVPASFALARQEHSEPSFSAFRVGAKEIAPAKTGLRAYTLPAADAVPPSPSNAPAAFREPDAIYVKNLPWAAGSDDVRQFFAKFADVQRVSFLTRADGRPLGYAFVHLRDPAQVDFVIAEANGKEMLGRELLVCRSIPRASVDARNRRTVFVSPLPLDVTAAEVAEKFCQFGMVEDVYIPANRESGKTAVHALVRFAEEAVAEEAAEATDGTQFLGRTVYAHRNFRRRPPRKAPELRIKNLPPETTVEQLREFYEALGPVTSVTLSLLANQGRNWCFGFVRFKNRRAAQEAKNTTNQANFLGRKLMVDFVWKDSAAVVFVRNLSGGCGAKALGLLCSEHGPVEGVSMHMRNNLAEGHGFVRLATREDARRVAAKIDGVEFMGKNISASINRRRFQVPV